MADHRGRFARRCAWELQPNALGRAVAARRAAGAPLVDLTLSNPTTAGIPYPAGCAQALAMAGLPEYRPAPAGLEAARAAVCGYYEDLGCRIEPDRVVLVASTSEGYGFLFKLLADSGDEVLVPRPSYPLFEYLAGLEGVTPRPYPLRLDERWRIDLDRMAAAIGPRTRAVVLVHPNNPTGSFVTTGEQRALIDLAGECGLALLVDEVFGDYAVGDDRDRAGSFAGSAEVLTCVLSGLSKVAGLPQLKLSWLVVQGPEAERREALARLEVIADTYLSVASPVQEALPALLGWRGPVQEAIRRRVRENLRHAQLRLPGAGVGRLLPCEGGWYAVIDLGPRDEDPVVLGLLEEDGVLVHPGYFYDFGREGFVVLSLLTPEEQFAHGLERLLQRVR